jgi:hypothetical protein
MAIFKLNQTQVDICLEVGRIRAARRLPSETEDFGWRVKQGKYQAVRIVFVEAGKSKRTRVEQLTPLMSAVDLLVWMKEQASTDPVMKAMQNSVAARARENGVGHVNN